jgi:RecA-family ATPase
VPIPLREKRPRISGWQNLRISETEASQYFSRSCNVGIKLGEASHGLVDVDLDCQESIGLGAEFLPATGAIFGRVSKPGSHRLYCITGSAPSLQFKDPITGDMLLELRGDRRQTVFPPSIHPSGELVEWEADGEPATIEYAVLKRAVMKVAAQILIERHLPGVKDGGDLLSSLDATDPRVAARIREWLELPQPSAHEPTLLVGSVAPNKAPSPAPFFVDHERRPSYVATLAREKGLAWVGLHALAEKDLNDCVRDLKNQEEPGRSNLLYKKSIRMGVLIANGHIGQAEVTAALYAASVSNGLVKKNGKRDAHRQIERGFKYAVDEAHESTPKIIEIAVCNPAGDVPAPTSQIISAPITEIEKTAIPSLEIFRADELMSRPAPPRRWIVDGWITRAETALGAGDGGTGKTKLFLQLAIACIAGTDWLGLKVQPCNVLYVSAEDPKDEIHFRLQQIAKPLQLPGDTLAKLKIIDLAGKDAVIARFERDGKIKPTPLCAEIEHVARDHGAGLVILDAVADFFGGNENERNEVRGFVALLRGLAMRLDAAVLIVAHPSVDAMRTSRGYSGSTAWNNSVRARLTFTKPPKADGQPDPDPDLRVLELAKSNRSRAGEQIYMCWTEAGFVRVASGTTANPTNELHAEQVFLQLLDKLTAQKRRVSHSRSSTFAPTEFARLPAGKELGKTALEAAMNRLFEKGFIDVVENGPTSKRRHFIARRSIPPSGQPAPRGAGP